MNLTLLEHVLLDQRLEFERQLLEKIESVSDNKIDYYLDGLSFY